MWLSNGLRFIDLLIRRSPALLTTISAKKNLTKDLTIMLASSTTFAAVYGAAIGSYNGGLQILYVAIKLPLLFLATLLISFAAMYILQQVIGCGLSSVQALRIALISISMTSIVLSSFAPIALLFSVSLKLEYEPHYGNIVLMHVLFFAVAGFVSLRYLWIATSAIITDRKKVIQTMVIWLIIYSFVGAQMAWMLRPFIGDYSFELEFLRHFSKESMIDKNFYSSVYSLLKELIR